MIDSGTDWATGSSASTSGEVEVDSWRAGGGKPSSKKIMSLNSTTCPTKKHIVARSSSFFNRFLGSTMAHGAPNARRHETSGLTPYSTSYGVRPPSARDGVRLCTYVAVLPASAQMEDCPHRVSENSDCAFRNTVGLGTVPYRRMELDTLPFAELSHLPHP